MINILVAAHSSHRLDDQLRLCQLIQQKSADFNFLFVMDGKLGETYLQKIKSAGFAVEWMGSLAPGKDKKSDEVSFKQKLAGKAFLKSIYTFIRVHFFYAFQELRKVKSIYTSYLQQYHQLLEIHQRFNSHVIITNGDRQLGIEPVFIKLGKEKSIKIVVPYLVYAHEEAPLALRKHNLYFRLFPAGPLINNFLKAKYPNNFLKYKETGHNYAFYAPSLLYALKKFGVLSSNPWFMGNGYADVICQDTDGAVQRHIDAGVSSSKLKVVGDYTFDTLYAQHKNKEILRQQLIQSYGLNPDLPITIIALPQLAEHGLLDWDSHWKYQRSLLKVISAHKTNILLSLHPRMKREQYLFTETEFSAKILNERIFEVLPAANFFVATYSSTIRWAILCGIPCLVTDYTRLNHKMFESFNSIRYAHNEKELEKEFSEMLNVELNFAEDWKEMSRDKIFDGHTIDRYIALLKENVGK